MASPPKAAQAAATDPPVSAQRSRIMAAIRGKDTKPEIRLRKALHRLGFRYRKFVSSMPGKPDLVFAKHRSVVFVHGCFWHGHDCGAFRLPATRTEYWKTKIEGNKKRDEKTIASLLEDNWRVLTVWECKLRDGKKGSLDASVKKTARFLCGKQKRMEIG